MVRIGPMYGKHHTEESKMKMSLAHSGKKLSNEHKECISDSLRGKYIGDKNSVYGKHHTEEWKKNMSLLMSGKNNHFYGKTHSEHTRIKMRQSRIKQIIPIKDTSIEVKLQNSLLSFGITFEKHTQLFGQPDIFIKPNICIFADGDYWHNLEKSKIRDKKVNRNLKLAGYKVIRFWEHDINKNLQWCVKQIINELK